MELDLEDQSSSLTHQRAKVSTLDKLYISVRVQFYSFKMIKLKSIPPLVFSCLMFKKKTFPSVLTLAIP